MPHAPPVFRPAGYKPARNDYQQEKRLPSRQCAKRKVYMTAAWARLREAVVIRDGSQCQACKRKGITTFVSLHVPKGGNGTRAIVDHIVPATTPDEVLCDISNLETQCPQCHQDKTNSRDGGFGNRRKG